MRHAVCKLLFCANASEYPTQSISVRRERPHISRLALMLPRSRGAGCNFMRKITSKSCCTSPHSSYRSSSVENRSASLTGRLLEDPRTKAWTRIHSHNPDESTRRTLVQPPTAWPSTEMDDSASLLAETCCAATPSKAVSSGSASHCPGWNRGKMPLLSFVHAFRHQHIRPERSSMVDSDKGDRRVTNVRLQVWVRKASFVAILWSGQHAVTRPRSLCIE